MELLRRKALELGAFRAEVLDVSRVSLDASFRSLCESNACGNYGRNYMCPPDAGGIEELMEEIRSYDRLMVYQTVGELEDSYDFEGMMEAGKRHNELAQKLRVFARGLCEERPGCPESPTACPESATACPEEPAGVNFLHLGAGGCRVCPVCAKVTGEPCRHPDLAMRSLETYGINVSLLAQEAGMRYINGQNTVTYFGAIFARGGRIQESEKTALTAEGSGAERAETKENGEENR